MLCSGQRMLSLGLREGCTGLIYTFTCSRQGGKAQIRALYELGDQENSLFGAVSVSQGVIWG